MIGTIENDTGQHIRRDALIRVTEVVFGSFPTRQYSVSHHRFDGSGLCPLGPNLRKGDTVAIYLRRAGTRLDVQGWLYKADALKADRRLTRTRTKPASP